MIIPNSSLYNSMLLVLITHQEQKHLKPYIDNSSVNRLKTGGLKGWNRSQRSKSYKKVTFKTI